MAGVLVEVERHSASAGFEVLLSVAIVLQIVVVGVDWTSADLRDVTGGALVVVRLIRLVTDLLSAGHGRIRDVKYIAWRSC